MFEYSVMEVKKNKLEFCMNLMAQDGWRVISVNSWQDWETLLIVTFEREKKE